MTKFKAWENFIKEHPVLQKEESLKVLLKIHTIRRVHETGFDAGEEYGYARGFAAARELLGMQDEFFEKIAGKKP